MKFKIDENLPRSSPKVIVFVGADPSVIPHPIQPLGAQASSLHWGIQNCLQARCLRSQLNQDAAFRHCERSEAIQVKRKL